MSDHNCGDPNCSGLHGSLADLITAYERKDPPFEGDTPAQNVLRRTFPIPVVVACGWETLPKPCSWFVMHGTTVA